jgi:hypothetical protein
MRINLAELDVSGMIGDIPDDKGQTG